MIRHVAWIACSLPILVGVTASGCGGGSKKPPKKVDVAKPDTPPPPPQETEGDRENKRRAAAQAIVAEGSKCLPASFKTDAPNFQIAAAGSAPMLCAIDRNPERLLGVIACWTVGLGDGTLTYADPKPLPGRGIPVKLDGSCARGYCVKDAKGSDRALMAWNEDASKVAVVAGDELTIFDVASKAAEKSFSIRGEKGVSNNPIGLAWLGGMFFVEGADDGPFSAVWTFKDDGTAVGAIEALGAKEPKALSTYGGSFLVLDKERVAVNEQGLTTLTTYEVATGKRAKITRKVTKPACKPAEIDSYWLEDMEKVPAKCKEEMEKTFGPFVGADALAGKNNHLFALRGSRIGELAVIEPKALTEKKEKLIKLPWCDGAGGGGDAAKGAKAGDE